MTKYIRVDILLKSVHIFFNCLSMPRFSYRPRPGNTGVEGLYAVNVCIPVCVVNALASMLPQGVLCQNILSYRDLGAFGNVATSLSMADAW